MNEKWLIVAGPVFTCFATLYASKLDLLGKKETSKDKVYDGWEKLYNTKSEDYDELKKENKEFKEEILKIREDFSKFKLDTEKKLTSMQTEIDDYKRNEVVYLNEITDLKADKSELQKENKQLKLYIKKLEENK